MTANGDRLKDVYEEHAARLWRAVYLYVGDRELAGDAVAEVFAQALRRGDDLRSPERWVWRTAFRVAAGELKRRSKEARSWADVGYQIPTETVELLAALPRLSPKQRAAIVLHYHSGYSLREVAEIIGSTPSAVGVHLHRGRKLPPQVWSRSWRTRIIPTSGSVIHLSKSRLQGTSRCVPLCSR